VTLLPKSLFGRLALLLLAVVAIALAATILFFRQDRAALLARQFGDTKIVQLQTLRAALEGADAPGQRETLARIGRQYGARIIPEAERPQVGMPAGPTPGLTELEARLREALGEETELRIAPGRGLLFVRIAAGGAGYWVGFPLPQRPQAEDIPSRAAIWSATLALVLLAAAFVFARYLARPLRELDAAVGRVGRGEMPSPLPEQGPSEIVNVNRGFNRMVAQLTQAEHDRALLLAGVSHDLRTPLARMRLAVELGGRDEALKAAMVDDIEEMDRIIGQFLDFARGDQTTAFESRLPEPLVAAAVDRYARAGSDVRFVAGGAPALPLKATAFARLVTNLVDNALKYGAPPVEVTTRVDGDRFVLDVADRGPGIDPADVARLKQPFTRANAARSGAPGGAGAGLGLAIVERIARLHGGSFDLLPREGGGALARVRLPLFAPADRPTAGPVSD
jgi:two-component system, OmpR family, osmolarity sensor histidine kinase EnvZ